MFRTQLVKRMVDVPGHREYQVIGKKGAVALTFMTLANEAGGKILRTDALVFHSLTPNRDKVEKCCILEGSCYPDWSYRKAYKLCIQWIDHDCNVKYLYAKLTKHYNYYFGRGKGKIWRG